MKKNESNQSFRSLNSSHLAPTGDRFFPQDDSKIENRSVLPINPTMAARKFLLPTSGGITAYATYKAKYDPPHLVWDLDATILCSVTPITRATNYHSFESFDQIDDDFPFESNVPNTRTYWRPGARAALQLFRYFAVQHVFTAAQETYTEHILDEMDRSLFHTIIHRDQIKQPNGKDLQHIVHSFGSNNSTEFPCELHRCILFDDRTKNFSPQRGQNGVHVVPFEVTNSSGSVEEYKEIARWFWISSLALLVPDVRTILPYFRSDDHAKRFENEKEVL